MLGHGPRKCKSAPLSESSRSLRFLMRQRWTVDGLKLRQQPQYHTDKWPEMETITMTGSKLAQEQRSNQGSCAHARFSQ